MKWKPFKIEIGEEDLITPSGLQFVGQAIRKTGLVRRVNALTASSANYSHADCILAVLGTLCQGKTAFEDVREMREQPEFYAHALGAAAIPSVETVRQRFDEIGEKFDKSRIAQETTVEILREFGVAPLPTFTGHIPIDADVSPHDNSGTKKEGVSYTYKGFDGYSPLYVYIGKDGWMLDVDFRDGSVNGQKGAAHIFGQSINSARRITRRPLLFRLDSGHDASDNIKLFKKEGVDFIIKRNLRKESVADWLETAKESAVTILEPREGKTVYIGSTFKGSDDQQVLDDAADGRTRIVFKVTVRTCGKNGQMMLTPDVDVATWWTSLDSTEDEIISLYQEHATCEQYHSEIKTDIGLERFPSGKRATNAAVLKTAMLAYNILRLIGHLFTKTDWAPKGKKKVERIRLRTVIQRFITIASRFVRHARETLLKLGRREFWRYAFIEINSCFSH